MKFPLLVLLLTFTSASLANATDSITLDSFTDQTQGEAVNLNANTAAWAYYGDNNPAIGDYDSDGGVPTTDASNLGDFTAFTDGVTGGYAAKNPNGADSVSFTGGVGGNNPSSVSNSLYWEQIQGSGNGEYFSITSKLFAATETLNFYLFDFDTTSDLTASLDDQANTTWSVSNKVLSGSGDGSLGTATELTLTVNGAVGDILTFTDTVDDTGVSNTQYGGITGLVAVDVAPEPSTWAMLFGGLAALAFVRRACSKRNA